jgi:hypothetical protein
MSGSDILFQYTQTTANATITEGDLIYVAPDGGQTMVRAMFLTGPEGGTSNVFRLHHCSETETPSAENMLFRGTVSYRDKIQDHYMESKLVLNPGDRLFAALHSGDAVTFTGYGLIPGIIGGIRTGDDEGRFYG